MHALVLGAGFDDNVNARLVRLGDDINILGRRAAGELPVGTDVVRALRHVVQIRDLFEQIFFDLIHSLYLL